MPARKLLLVNPVNPLRTGFTASLQSRFPPLSLGILAALTPDHWEVELVDENFDAFTMRPADLVAITAFTSSVNRAYEIAELYRAACVPVVLGGIHASMRRNEALQFVDTVVAGEAESVWQKVLSDFEQRRLASVYEGALGPLEGRCRPRRDLFHRDYAFASIQTSRGCPLDCDFCSVTALNGRRYRRRPAAEVLDEMAQTEQELLFFVDDNLVGYGEASRMQAMQLFQGIVERGIEKRWFCQATVNVADDPELLEWAARAGCRMIFLGMEAEESEALAAVNKRLNASRGVDAYEQIFSRIHAAGMAVLGAFIFGIDGDTPDRLARRADYIISCGVDVMQTTAVTPLPGTRLFDKLNRENRLLYHDFPADWERYNLTDVVFEPSHMTTDEFSETMRRCLDRIYDMRVLKRKAKQTFAATGSWEAAEFAWQANMSYREIAHASSTFPRAPLKTHQAEDRGGPPVAGPKSGLTPAIGVSGSRVVGLSSPPAKPAGGGQAAAN